jgi:branched-chain amino acid aminotransferase
VTLPRLHRDHPHVKDTRFIPSARRAYAGLPPGIEEGLLLSDTGAILEGLSSNFFAVLDGALRTDEEHVLAGITRALVLDAAQPLAPVVRQAVRRDDLRRVEEAFITSASRGVLPVVRIDDEPVGAGRVGGLTRAVTDAYAVLVAGETDERF